MDSGSLRIAIVTLRSFFGFGIGEVKVSRWLAKQLVSAGVPTRIISFASREQLASLGITASPSTNALSLDYGGAEVTILVLDEPLVNSDPVEAAKNLAEEILEFMPTHVVTNATYHFEILSRFLNVLSATSTARRLLFVHNLNDLPFGPLNGLPASLPGIEEARQAIEGLAGLLCPSDFVVRYAQAHGTVPAFCLYPVEPESEIPPRLGNFENPFVTMINPCELKGLSLFLELARQFPAQDFAAVESWGTGSKELDLLKQRPNVTVLPTTAEMNKVYAKTRVALVPSRVNETFGLVAVEAKLRGIPVLASNIGGLPEAVIDGRILLPIESLSHDSHQGKNSPSISAGGVSPWIDALEPLLNDRAFFEAESTRARDVSARFTSTLTLEPLRTWLSRL